MSLRKGLLLVIVFFGFQFPLIAQQDAQFSQFMFNRLFFNPAFAGTEGDIHITALHRSQWVAYNTTYDGRGGAPTSQVISASMAFPRAKSGLGIHMVNDKLGALGNTEVQLSYAHHIITKTGFVSLGLRGGMYSQSLNFDRLRWDDPGDPNRRFGRETQMAFDFGTGIYFRSNQLSGGLSYNHVSRPEFDFGQIDLTNPLEGHIYLTGSYDFNVSPDWDVTPSILIKSLALHTYSIDLNVIATYNSKVWGGVSLRNTEAAIAMIGFSMLKDGNLKIGYAFDYVIEAQEVKAPTSHEFMARYIIPRKTTTTGRKIVRTPRFRF
jgi:type IX secretion system PorP/SprF family membrane protein